MNEATCAAYAATTEQFRLKLERLEHEKHAIERQIEETRDQERQARGKLRASVVHDIESAADAGMVSLPFYNTWLRDARWSARPLIKFGTLYCVVDWTQNAWRPRHTDVLIFAEDDTRAVHLVNLTAASAAFVASFVAGMAAPPPPGTVVKAEHWPVVLLIPRA